MLQKYDAQHVFRGELRHYVTPDGNVYPGVTTILKATAKAKDKETLVRWRERVGDEEADRVTNTARERGTGMHSCVEDYLRDIPIDPPQHVLPYWQSIKPILDEHVTNVKLIEGAVWHPIGYAGSVDCVADFDGVPCVLDWKTSSNPKPDKWIQDYFTQIAAYGAAVKSVYGEAVRVAGGVVIIAIPGRPAQVKPMAPNFVLWHWKKFKKRVELFYDLQKEEEALKQLTA